MTEEEDGRYLDEEDVAEQQDRLEEQQGDVEDVEWANVPQQRKQESLYTLFNKVWKSQDSSKVANLDTKELGPFPIMAVRNAQFLSLLGVVTRHNKFAAFFNQLAEITLKTSASKKGWFTELFVSQKKSTSRFSGSPFGQSVQQGQHSANNFKPRRFNLFGAGSQESVTNE